MPAAGLPDTVPSVARVTPEGRAPVSGKAIGVSPGAVTAKVPAAPVRSAVVRFFTTGMLLAMLIPVLITLPLEFHFVHPGAPPSSRALGLITLLSTALNLLLVPLQAGYLQVIDAAECNLPARARDVFKPYLKGEAPRLIGYGLVVAVSYLALFAIVGVVTGGAPMTWHGQMLGAQTDHQPPALPEHFWLAMSLIPVLTLFMLGFFAISLGQVALSNRGVFAAIGDGITGTLKNVLPLLMFVIGLILASIVAAIGMGIAAAVFALLAKLVGGWLIAVLIIPLYIAFVLILFSAMFGVMYHIWCDVCCADPAAGTAEPVAA